MTIGKIPSLASAGEGGTVNPSQLETGKLGLARVVKPIDESAAPVHHIATKVQREFLVVEEQLHNAPDRVVVAKPSAPLPMMHIAPLAKPMVKLTAVLSTAAATHALGLKPLPGEWIKQENEALKIERKLVGEKYFDTKKGPHEGFLGFLQRDLKPEIVSQFKVALQENAREKFVTLFEHCSRTQLKAINDCENLDVIPDPAFIQNPKITAEHIKQLQVYMENVGFSGVVSLSVGPTMHIMKSSSIDTSGAPMSIHSVGKVFTGVLLLDLIQKGIIKEEALDQPIKLPATTLKRLPPSIRAHVERTTLRQMMVHESGIGDYLGNYQKAIDAAVSKGLPPPIIRNAEDLLDFADDSIVPLKQGESRYSNLGILLVGLSIEHHYNKNAANQAPYMPYNEILRKELVRPAGLTSFSENKPNHALYNPTDHIAPHVVGGPAGGYWMTAQDLTKFGQYIASKYEKEDASKPDSLHQLLAKHGEEFYGNSTLGHVGAVPGASCDFKVYLEQGVTLSVLANQDKINDEFSAVHLSSVIFRHMLSE